MGIFPIIIYTIWIRNIYVYGLENLPKEYILSFLPSKKEVDSFPVKYYEEKLKNTGNFKTVKIEKIGKDTIDLWVILKEKPRFSLLLPIDLTPTNKYTIGIGMMDRFFLRSEQKLKILIYFLNMKKMEIFWINYRRKLFPFLWFKYVEYEHSSGYLFKETPFLIGFYKSSNFIFFLSMGKTFIKFSREKTENPFRFYGGFYLPKERLYLSKSFLFDYYNIKKIFFSDSFFFSLSFYFKDLIFNSSIKGVFQEGYIPLYRKIFWGGYENLRSYSFGTFIGNNGLMYEIDILYPIIPARDSSLSLGILFFGEAGNTYDNYKELKNKKIFKGFGSGFRITSPSKEILDIFITYNQKRNFGFGISFQKKMRRFEW